MLNSKILYDFMNHFDLVHENITVESDEFGIFFMKPTEEKYPLEYFIHNDLSYTIKIFKDTNDGNGYHITLEEGTMERKERKDVREDD